MLGGWAPLVPAGILSRPLTLHCQGRGLRRGGWTKALPLTAAVSRREAGALESPS